MKNKDIKKVQIEKIMKEYREKFGLCTAKDEKCECYEELKWLKKTLLKISDASIKDYEEKLWAACDTDEDTDALARILYKASCTKL